MRSSAPGEVGVLREAPPPSYPHIEAWRCIGFVKVLITHYHTPPWLSLQATEFSRTARLCVCVCVSLWGATVRFWAAAAPEKWLTHTHSPAACCGKSFHLPPFGPLVPLMSLSGRPFGRTFFCFGWIPSGPLQCGRGFGSVFWVFHFRARLVILISRLHFTRVRNYTVRLILSDGNSFIYFVRFIPKADFKIGELRRMYFYAYSIIQNSVWFWRY